MQTQTYKPRPKDFACECILHFKSQCIQKMYNICFCLQSTAVEGQAHFILEDLFNSSTQNLFFSKTECRKTCEQWKMLTVLFKNF